MFKGEKLRQQATGSRIFYFDNTIVRERSFYFQSTYSFLMDTVLYFLLLYMCAKKYGTKLAVLLEIQSLRCGYSSLWEQVQRELSDSLMAAWKYLHLTGSDLEGIWDGAHVERRQFRVAHCSEREDSTRRKTKTVSVIFGHPNILG